MNKIIINRGSFRLDEIVFEQGTTTIGRANDNTISLNDTAVSSHHAKIVTIFHTSYIEDLDSTNGTLVNGKTVQKHSLHSGDVISVGNHQLLFQSDSVGHKPSETSETVMLHGNEIKQKLTEFIQAQSEQAQQPSPEQTTADKQAEISTVSDAVKNNTLGDSKSPPAFGSSPSLDREKNKAWLEAKKSPTSDEKPAPATISEFKKPPEAGDKAIPAKVAAAEKTPNPQAIRNTATAIKTGVLPTAATTTSTNETTDKANNIPNGADSASATPASTNNSDTAINNPAIPAASKTTTQPEQKTAVDIAAAARAATQNRRNTDNSYISSQGVVAINRSKQRNKIMPMIWLLIVAVLVTEVIYITYRSLG